MECIIYMGAEDVRRQALNVFRIRMLGAEVIPVHSGSCTLKDAVNEALRDWVTNLSNTHYLIGSAIGPHPFPTIVRDFQRVIGQEIKSQLKEQTGKEAIFLELDLSSLASVRKAAEEFLGKEKELHILFNNA